jgi:hypothetical protein
MDYEHNPMAIAAFPVQQHIIIFRLGGESYEKMELSSR